MFRHILRQTKFIISVRYRRTFIKDCKTGKVYSEKELLKSFPDYNWNDGGEEEAIS